MQKHTTCRTEYTKVWLARIFPNLWLLGDNAEKPQNKRRRKGKKHKYPIQGLKLLPQSYFPITLSSCLATWEPSPSRTVGQISTPDFLCSVSHSFKAQTYLQFQPTSFHVARIRHWKASTLLYQEDLDVNHTPGIEQGHPSTPPSVLKKTKDSLNLKNHLAFFLRLLSCRRIDKWQ